MSWFRKAVRALDPSRVAKKIGAEAERAVGNTGAAEVLTGVPGAGSLLDKSVAEAERAKDSVVAAYHDARDDIRAESERGTVNSLLISGGLAGMTPGGPFSDLAYELEEKRHKKGVKKIEGAFDQDIPDPPPVLPEAASLSKQVPLGALSDTGRAGLGSGSLLSSIRPTRGGAGRTYLV